MVGDGVFEMKLVFGGGYRTYAATVGVQIILLLCGGDKRSQAKDIAKAKEFYEDYREKHPG
jgi:putative addiction module killer protein